MDVVPAYFGMETQFVAKGNRFVASIPIVAWLQEGQTLIPLIAVGSRVIRADIHRLSLRKQEEDETIDYKIIWV